MHASVRLGSAATLRFLEVARARRARPRPAGLCRPPPVRNGRGAMLRIAPLTMVAGSGPRSSASTRAAAASTSTSATTGCSSPTPPTGPHRRARPAGARSAPAAPTTSRAVGHDSGGADLRFRRRRRPTNLQQWSSTRPWPTTATTCWTGSSRCARTSIASPTIRPRPHVPLATPTHPDFMEAAYACAAVRWNLSTALRPRRAGAAAGYGDHPFETTVAALGILVLAFGNGRCGDTAGQRFGHHALRDGMQGVGASARWAQETWQFHAEATRTSRTTRSLKCSPGRRSCRRPGQQQSFLGLSR